MYIIDKIFIFVVYSKYKHMITSKQFTGNIRGRDSKYKFDSLEPGTCMVVHPEGNIKKFRHNVSAALYQWKTYNGYKWTTAVRIENDKISVYRIK